MMRGSAVSLIVALGCSLLAGCIGIRSLSVSELDPAATETVRARADAIGILHLIVPRCADLEDQVVRELAEQGATKNVRIRYQVRDFLLAIQLHQVVGSAEK